jgi:hypothetical protein
MWVQFLRMLWVGNGWAAANKVIRGSNEIYQEVSPITHVRKMEVSTGMRPATRPRCDCFLIKDTFGIAKKVEVSQDEIFQNFRPLRTNAPPCFTLKRRELVIMESIFKWRAFLAWRRCATTIIVAGRIASPENVPQPSSVASPCLLPLPHRALPESELPFPAF